MSKKSKFRAERPAGPAGALVIVESPTKRGPIERGLHYGLKRALERAAEGDQEAQQIVTQVAQREHPEGAINESVRWLQTQLAGQHYRVVPTFGHFRSLMPMTPQSNKPPKEPQEWEWPRWSMRWSPAERQDFIASYQTFLRDNPAQADDDPLRPETNPRRFMAIDVDQNFAPYHITTNPQVITKLREALQSLGPSGVVYVATDPDREGEWIAAHVRAELQAQAEELGRPLRMFRLRYHSMHADDLAKALAEAGDWSRALAASACLREIMDRLVGYPVSRALRPIAEVRNENRVSVSAGRVQIAALQILMEADEKALQQLPQVHTQLKATGHIDGLTLRLQLTAARPLDVAVLPTLLARQPGTVAELSGGERLEQHPEPFMSLADLQDTMRCDAVLTRQPTSDRPSRPTAKQVLAAAQRLFEAGLQSYPRTDSKSLTSGGLTEVRRLAEAVGLPIREKIGRGPKTEGAQEAHEALRPKVPLGWSGPAESPTTPLDVAAVFLKRWMAGEDLPEFAVFAKGKIKGDFTPLELRVYDVVLRRTLAKLMPSAVSQTTKLRVDHPALEGETLEAVETVHEELGFHALWQRRDAGGPAAWDKAGQPVALADITTGSAVRLADLQAELEFVRPRRPSAQGLVRELDSRGIGRPSSVAGLLDTLERRGYVRRRQGGMTRFGALITLLLREGLGELANVELTAEWEKALDDLARQSEGPDLGSRLSRLRDQLLERVYRGQVGHPGLLERLDRLRKVSQGWVQALAESTPGFREDWREGLRGWEGIGVEAEPLDGWTSIGALHWRRDAAGRVWFMHPLKEGWITRVWASYEDNHGMARVWQAGVLAPSAADAERLVDWLDAGLQRLKIPGRWSLDQAWAKLGELDSWLARKLKRASALDPLTSFAGLTRAEGAGTPWA